MDRTIRQLEREYAQDADPETLRKLNTARQRQGETTHFSMLHLKHLAEEAGALLEPSHKNDFGASTVSWSGEYRGHIFKVTARRVYGKSWSSMEPFLLIGIQKELYDTSLNPVVYIYSTADDGGTSIDIDIKSDYEHSSREVEAHQPWAYDAQSLLDFIIAEHSERRTNPDRDVRSLERRYKQGDVDAGVQLLSALIRSGQVSQRNVELAAIYQHPVAMQLMDEPKAAYGTRDEDRILPLKEHADWSRKDWPWICEIYQIRMLALTKWAYEQALYSGISDIPAAVRQTINYAAGVLSGSHPVRKDQHSAYVRQLMNLTQEYLSPDHDYRAVLRLLFATSAVIRAIECDNNNHIVSDSGPAWACASAAYSESHRGDRDPSLPDEPSLKFGPDVLEAGYQAIADGLVPWLLHPFPV